MSGVGIAAIAQSAPGQRDALLDRVAALERASQAQVTAGSYTKNVTTSAYTTGLLSAGAAEEGLITLAPAFALIGLTTNIPSRVTLYACLADRTIDLGRPWGVDPPAGVGVILDYLTTGTFTGTFSPTPEGYSTETPAPSASIPIRIYSTSVTGAVTLGLTWIGTN